MRDQLTLDSKLNECRILYLTKNQITIAVEGDSDVLVFKQFYDCELLRFEPHGGYENVLNLINHANLPETNYLLGIIDKDYHTLSTQTNHKYAQVPNIIYTDNHDVEMLMFESTAFEKYLSVLSQEHKLKSIPDARSFLFQRAEQIGALRLYSINQHLDLYFEGMDYEKFFDRKSAIINNDAMVAYITHRTRCEKQRTITQTDAEIISATREILDVGYDPRILCNGHDVLNLLSICMKFYFSNISTDELRIFCELLLAYNNSEFERTAISNNLNEWVRRNIPSHP